MWRISLSILMAFALTVSNAQELLARDLLKSVQIETQVYQLVSQAEQAIAANNYSTALPLLLQAAQHDPTSYTKNVHRDLMQVYVALNQYENAINEAKRALLRNPGDEYATYVMKGVGCYYYLSKGQEANNERNYAEAKAWFKKAAQFDPSQNSAYIHSSLCYALKNLGETAAAIEEGKRALSFDPNNETAAYTIALAYGDQAQFDDALSWMRRYLALERDASRRQDAADTLQSLENDRKQFLDANNKKGDYLDVMRDKSEDLVRWPQNKLPIKVLIGSGRGVRGHKPEFNNLVKVALDNWCQASGKRLDYKITASADDADIIVKWTKDPLDSTEEHANLQTLGLTQLRSDSKGVTRAAVEVRTVDPFNPDRVVSDSECAHVVLHEIGHALGIGHSKMIKDVMYFRAAPMQRALTLRDKSTIARLYQDYPIIGFVPKHEETPAAASTPVAPPAFLPPEVPDDSKVKPPMFIPPAIPADERLTPPMFVPPAADQQRRVDVPVPMFVPPGVKTSAPPPAKTTPKKPAPKINAPFFVPPGAK